MKKPNSDHFSLVSIVVACLNEEKRLTRLFQTISYQPYRPLEIIINDSPRSVDNTQALIKKWRPVLPIVYLRQNLILGQARLLGSKSAHGQYLLHLDADLLPTPGLITDCIELIKQGAKAVKIPEEVIGSGYWVNCKWLEKRCYQNDEAVTSPRFFETQAYFAAGGHNPRLALSEDKDIDLRFQSQKLKVVWTKHFLLHQETELNPLTAFRSKFFWSLSGFEFLKARPKSALTQILFIFFRPAYFKNWRLLLSYPHLTLGMFILKACELTGAALGGLGTKLNLLKPINYKTVKK